MPLLVLAAALLAGIVAGARLDAPLPLLAGLAALAAVGVLRFRRARTDALLCAGCCAFLLGAARYDAHVDALNRSPLLSLTGASVQLTGVVVEEPDLRPRSQHLVLEVRTVRRSDTQQEASGRVLAVVSPLPPYRYGDVLALRGVLEAPVNFAPGFDYRAYLYRRGILATMAFPTVEVQASGAGAPWKAALLDLRALLGAALDQRLPEPEGALVKGILLGMRAAVPDDLADAFRRTGTTHILAISGQNLSIAAGLAVLLGRRLLGRRHPVFAAAVLGSVWGYALLVGLPLSVLRAAVMATLMLAASFVGRQNSGLPALLAAAALMAVFDPLVPWDLGYQLSCLAMGGILFLAPLLELAFWRVIARDRIAPEGWPAVLTGWLVTGFAGVLGATLATLPVTVLNFATLPLVALPATLFAVPLLPLILLAGAGAAGFGALADSGAFGPLATPLHAAAGAGTLAVYLAASGMIAVVRTFAALPMAAMRAPPAPEALVWLYAAVLLLVLARSHRRFGLELRQSQRGPSFSLRTSMLRSRRAALIAGAVMAAVLLWVGNPAWAAPDGRLRLWALDTGDGDAVLLRTPGGVTVLVDGGPDPARLGRALGGILPFWERRIGWVVLTAPQRDRIIGLRDVLLRYQVGGVIEGPGRAATVDYREWERLLEARRIPRRRLDAGERHELEPGTTLEVLAVPAPPRPGDRTLPGSLALRVTSPAGSVVLLGEGSGDVGEAVIARSDGAPLAVLKLHRRGRPEVPAALLDALAPRLLVLTGAVAGPPEGAGDLPVWWTQQHGTVEVIMEAGGLWASGER